MVLIHYRFRVHIQLELKFTNIFAFQSRGMWLIEWMPCTRVCKWQTGLSPSSVYFFKRLSCGPPLARHLDITFKARGSNFHVELIPFHSQLIRKSCLVSFPPLTYMLKFSEFASLTSWHVFAHRDRYSKTHNATSIVSFNTIVLCKLIDTQWPYQSQTSH